MTDTQFPPLHNVRVLDLSRVVAGPLCTMMLADLGAEVIKIEAPQHGDDARQMQPPAAGGESALYLSANRSKKSVAIDIRTAAGRRIIFELAAKCDVLVENFRPGTAARLGIDYDALSARFPRLIYCSISGYGQQGPLASRGGFDPVLQAESGMMSINGDPAGGPLRHPLPLSDITTAHYAVQSILSALLVRHTSDRGQHIDLALFDVAVATMLNFNQHYLVTHENPPRLGNEHPSAVPVALFNTPSGPFYMAVANDRLFTILCEQVLQQPDIIANPLFASNTARVVNREALMNVLKTIFATDTRENWLDKLIAAGLPAGAVRTVAENLNAPEVQARGLLTDVLHPTAQTLQLVKSPIRFSDTPLSDPVAPPLLGQHTEAVLQELLGYDQEALQNLRDTRVIGPGA
jgi:crotonobetainyl-CoA:carnitine CoA-transferase CaiB-like acyl-CoA transferase